MKETRVGEGGRREREREGGREGGRERAVEREKTRENSKGRKWKELGKGESYKRARARKVRGGGKGGIR